MNRLFITGMGRSGTTLLDRLLTNHPDIDVLSQPLPFFFIETKKRFLKKMGVEKYYVLNDDLINREYTQSVFDDFLTGVKFSKKDIQAIFSKMKNYSGQLTKAVLRPNDLPRFTTGFKDLIETCSTQFETSEGIGYFGTKEIMCEEFIPYLCKVGYKCIVIVRDPRDVLASANYPVGEKYLGSKKPALFILKNWRKCVEFVYLLRDQENFHFLRYEDLVNRPIHELNLISDFLGMDRFSDHHFDHGILNRTGDPWKPNTSHAIKGSFVSKKLVGTFRTILSEDEIAYTEAVCGYEMEWMNYPFDLGGDKVSVIESYRDAGALESKIPAADFGSQQEQVRSELNRLEKFRGFFGTGNK